MSGCVWASTPHTFGNGETVAMARGDARRESRVLANYTTTANLEKRQSLLSFVTAVEGRHPSEVIAAIASGSEIVDVGCGNGVWARHAQERGVVVGIDVSIAMLRGARKRGVSGLICGDARGLPLADRSADVVLMLWVLYHVPDKPTALREARRVLRPGGCLIAATNEMAEDGIHVDLIKRAFGEVLGRRIDRWIEPLDFHVANGQAILAEYFSSVVAEPWNVDFELTDSTSLADYVDSVRGPIELELGAHLPWAAILRALRRLVDERIRTDGALRFRRRGVTFIAS
jgi:ubiquinone/menaquinone biosynthesis C-methylase UbiE